jgi:hypothetical protein
MMTTTKRYSGIVHLGQPYVSPAGVDCVPVKFRIEGIVVEFRGGNFAFTKVVRRADFAGYTRKA